MRHLRPKPTSRCPKQRPNEKCSPRLVPVVPAWVLHFFTMRAGPLGTVAKSCSRNVQRSLRTMAILAIYSEQAIFRKKTCGSRWLRVLLNGFRKRSDAYSADHWVTSPQQSREHSCLSSDISATRPHSGQRHDDHCCGTHYRRVGPNKFMAKPSPICARPDSPLSIFLARSWSPQRPWWPDAEKTDVERFGTSPCVVRGVL